MNIASERGGDFLKIKICGITNEKEAGWLNECQVDFAGFVLFYPKSKRCLPLGDAERILKALEPQIKRVAVVVSPSLQEVLQIQEAGFDRIQIHGQLSEEVLENVEIPILKAFNVTDLEHFDKYSKNDAVEGYVFDAKEPGSGQGFDWKMVSAVPRDGKMRILAGGLRPDNVADAIRAVQPDGVDVSSGVESAGGGKDREKVHAFVRAVREASSAVL